MVESTAIAKSTEFTERHYKILLDLTRAIVQTTDFDSFFLTRIDGSHIVFYSLTNLSAKEMAELISSIYSSSSSAMQQLRCNNPREVIIESYDGFTF